MKNKNYLMTALMVLTAVFISCGGNNEKSESAINVPVSVRTVTADIGEIEITKTFGGNVEGIEQSDLFARIPEVVVGVNVELGERVKTGQVLVNLDKDGANSRYFQARAAYENARKNFERMKYLLEQKAVSEQSYDQAYTAFKVAEADFKSASSLVELKSPIDGVVTSISVTVGQPAVVGKPLVTVARTDRVIIRFMVGEEDARRIKMGSVASVFTGLPDNPEVKGKVSKVADSADPATRGFEVEILVDNSKGWFKPGTFVKAELVLGRYENVLIIPREAVFLKAGKSYVYKNVGGHADLTAVEIGGETADLTYIKSGLNRGDEVITTGKNLIVVDDSLRIMNN